MTSFPSLCLAAVVLAQLLIFTPLHPQEASQNPASGTKAASKDSLALPRSSPQKLLVQDGTHIKLNLKRGVRSQYSKMGDEVAYLVDEEVLVQAKIIVPDGAR